jgi:murein DD-endopeptidase MepM/ murein hydrolase activator NlpD
MKRFPLPDDAWYSYTQRYGTGPGDHHGTDIFAAAGTSVRAVEDGYAHTALDPKGGKVVYLKSDDGEGKSGHHEYYYAHLADWDVLEGLEPGEEAYVMMNAPIGHVGNTGNAVGTDPHLHIQMKVDGKQVDPYPYLQAVDKRAGGGPIVYQGKPHKSWLDVGIVWIVAFIGILWLTSKKRKSDG